MTKKGRFNIFSLWKNYWFYHPSKISLEACRIVLAMIYIYVNDHWAIYNLPEFLSYANVGNYHPTGILNSLLAKQIPSLAVLETVKVIAYISPVMLLLGIFSRFSLVLTLLSNLYIRAFLSSFQPDWSHGFNVIFLAHLGFLFAPVGRYFSIDYLIRKKIFKKEPLKEKDNAGFWAILLAQWAVALMFFNAFFWKIYGTHHELSFLWGWSDNLRNQIITGSLYIGDPIPDRVMWIVLNPVAFKGLATVNLIFQAGTVLSLFFVRKPLWRFLFGLIFIFEEIGLAYVMDLRDYQWFPLIVFFIDWDALYNWIKRKMKRTETLVLPQVVPISKPKILLYSFYILAFLGVYNFIAFGFTNRLMKKTHFDLNTYPFSQFAMHSETKAFASRPYHQIGGAVEAFSTENPKNIKFISNRLTRHNYWVYAYRDSADIRNHLESMFRFCDANKNWYGIKNMKQVDSLETYRIIFEFAQYPNQPEVRIKHKGLVGKMNRKGVFKYAHALAYQVEDSDPMSKYFEYFLEIKHCGYTDPQISVDFATQIWGERKPLGGVVRGNKYYFSLPQNVYFLFFIKIKDKNSDVEDVYMPMHMMV